MISWALSVRGCCACGFMLAYPFAALEMYPHASSFSLLLGACAFAEAVRERKQKRASLKQTRSLTLPHTMIPLHTCFINRCDRVCPPVLHHPLRSLPDFPEIQAGAPKPSHCGRPLLHYRRHHPHRCPRGRGRDPADHFGCGHIPGLQIRCLRKGKK